MLTIPVRGRKRSIFSKKNGRKHRPHSDFEPRLEFHVKQFARQLLTCFVFQAFEARGVQLHCALYWGK